MSVLFEWVKIFDLMFNSKYYENKHHYFCPLGINILKIPLLLSITPQNNNLELLFFYEYPFTAQRNLAERARGFPAISCADGRIGSGAISL
jgi:hypothetical protein